MKMNHRYYLRNLKISKSASAISINLPLSIQREMGELHVKHNHSSGIIWSKKSGDDQGSFWNFPIYVGSQGSVCIISHITQNGNLI